MRRSAVKASLLALPLFLTGCTGFGTFLDHTFSPPWVDPTLPMADSENVRRILGQPASAGPLTPESGNVWPGPIPPEPTLGTIASHPGVEDRRGFPPTTVPGETPGLPDNHQPRPLGSSTPPGNAPPPPAFVPNVPPARALPGLRNNPRLPGGVIQTPSGPATDAGGTNTYRELTTPQGPGAIIVPNGNGTSTIINPNGTVTTVPTPR